MKKPAFCTLRGLLPLVLLAVATACNTPVSTSKGEDTALVGRGTLTITIPSRSSIFGTSPTNRAMTVADRVRLELASASAPATVLDFKEFVLTSTDNSPKTLIWTVAAGEGYVLRAFLYNSAFSATEPEVLGTSLPFDVIDGGLSFANIWCLPVSASTLVYNQWEGPINLASPYVLPPQTLVPGTDRWYSFTPTDPWVEVGVELPEGSTAVPFAIVVDSKGSFLPTVPAPSEGAALVPLPIRVRVVPNEVYYLLVLDGGLGTPAERPFRMKVGTGIEPGYTVTFVTNGGDAVAAVTAPSGALISPPSPPSKARFDFVGWYANPEMTIPWAFDTDKIGTTNVTLYAKWDVSLAYRVASREYVNTAPGKMIQYAMTYPATFGGSKPAHLSVVFQGRGSSSEHHFYFATSELGWHTSDQLRINTDEIAYIGGSNSAVASFLMQKLRLPAYLSATDSMQWYMGVAWNGNCLYSIAPLASFVAGGTTYTDCMRVDFASAQVGWGDQRGHGFYILARNVGLIHLEVTAENPGLLGVAGDVLIYDALSESTLSAQQLQLRVVDSAGTPLPGVWLDFNFGYGANAVGTSFQTNSDGKVQIPVYFPIGDNLGSVHLYQSSIDGVGQNVKAVPIPTNTGGTINLGDVVYP